jgi:hypothetical protein
MLGVLLVPVAVSSQMPPLAKLIVKSSPSGAKIFINGKVMDQPTDAVFVVAPSSFKVSVSGNANCGEYSVTLKSGDTRTLFCSAGTWTVQ